MDESWDELERMAQAASAADAVAAEEYPTEEQIVSISIHDITFKLFGLRICCTPHTQSAI